MNEPSDQKIATELFKSSEVIRCLIGKEGKLKNEIVVRSGKNIILTCAKVEDAEFILSLRNDEKLNRFVSKVSPELSKQRQWLEEYKKREAVFSEFYFIIRDLNMKPLGTVRLYDFQSNSFCWGSWMVSSEGPRKTAIESAICVYEFAFYDLGFKRSHFDVRNENKKVIAFHKRMGAKEVRRDDQDSFFIYEIEEYEKIRDKYRSLLK